MFVQKFTQNRAEYDDVIPPCGPVQINRGRWTKRERRIFEEGFKKYGKEWKLIAHLIQTRTVIQIRTHAQKYFQKLAKQTGGPVMSTSKKEKLQNFPPNYTTALNSGVSSSPASILTAPVTMRHSGSGRKRKLSDPSFPVSRAITSAAQFQQGKIYNLRRDSSRRKGRGFSVDQLMGSSSEQGSVNGDEMDVDSEEEDEISKELAFYNNDLSTSKLEPEREMKRSESGRVTPRMLAAATILMAPRFCNQISEKRLNWATATLAKQTKRN